MPGLRCLMFDLDGTLVDSLDGITTALNRAFTEFRLSPTDRAAVARCIGGSDRQLVAGLIGERNGLADRVTECFRQVYPLVAKGVLYPGVTESVRRYRRSHIKIAVVTNKPVALAKYTLDDAGLNKLVDRLAADDRRTPLKPEPDLLLQVLHELRVAPGEAMMVGDSAVDVLAGRAAKVHTCGVTYGIGDRSELMGAHPDFVVGDLCGLERLVEKEFS